MVFGISHICAAVLGGSLVMALTGHSLGVWLITMLAFVGLVVAAEAEKP